MYNWIFCSCLYLQSNITWFWALLINIFILLFPGVCFPSNFSRWSTDTWKDISVNIAVRYPVNADTAVPGSCEFHRECACKHHQDCRVSWSRWSRQQTPSFAAGGCWSLYLQHTHHRNSHFPHESGLAELALESLHRDVYGPNCHC